MTLEQILVYPLKSGAGRAVDRWTVGARGLLDDRRWMVVDDNDRFMTARQWPKLVLVRSEVLDSGFQLSAPGFETLRIEWPSGDSRSVHIWGQDTPARDGGEQAARWISEFLGHPCRLAYQGEHDRRGIEDWPGVGEHDVVSFADAYPVLLIGTASLDSLNARLERPVTMDRFRPNLVVATDQPFIEDRWRRLRVGECEFEVVKRCARCVLITVDPTTGVKDEHGEPLRTLGEFRLDREAQGILFGVNLIPRVVGSLEVDDPVTTIDR